MNLVKNGSKIFSKKFVVLKKGLSLRPQIFQFLIFDFRLRQQPNQKSSIKNQKWTTFFDMVEKYIRE